MAAKTDVALVPVGFETHPDRYHHIVLEVAPPIARIKLRIDDEHPLRPGYTLKLNSYDLGVDIELADAVQRLRFEHPEVTAVVITSALEGIFSSGANIFMLGSSTHGFKVNFCKFTNETRLYIEDATEHSGQTYVAALNGIASGGGYELPLACKEIYLIDDRRSAVALPEVPYLGVLPGTGGLTRVVDKRKVRRDLADVFCTLAEGVKGKRAVEWNLVDAVWPTSTFQQKVDERVKQIAGKGRPERKGVALEPITPKTLDDGYEYRHVSVRFGPVQRTVRLELRGPTGDQKLPADPTALGSDWYALRAFRELDDALLRLRFNHPDIGLILFSTKGDPETALKMDAELVARKDHWFVHETLHHMKRVLKRLDQTARSCFAIVKPGSCFAGSLFELALAADRSYALADPDQPLAIALSPLNDGALPMATGLSRLDARFYGEPSRAASARAHRGTWDAEQAYQAGLVTFAPDDIDWDDEVRIAIEERVSISPDALTGMEANLRWPGPETMETRIFGRLSAWQNWIFTRPNSTGERGALTLYGRPERPEFDWRRT